MFFQCSTEPFTIDYKVLNRFISSCHWQYLRKYNLFGHHGLGWGFAYIPEFDCNKLIIKRDFNPIYHSDWKNLSKIKTTFLLVHARKSYPWKKKFENIHPISIGEKYLITHNGVIKNSSFPKLKCPDLQLINSSTDLDTRKYLCYLLDELNEKDDLKIALEYVFKNLKLGAGANAFLFNSTQCNVINYHNKNFNGRHHTLFILKEKSQIFVSTTPIKLGSKEIPNNCLIQIDLNDLSLKIHELRI
jgi:predicted glutamine amidotransferase